MTLDIRTIGIFSAITPFLLGLIMLFYLKERKVYDGFRHWISANFGLSLGYALVSLQDLIPVFLSDILGNLFILYSLILIYEGIQQFYDRPWFSRVNYFVLGVYAVLEIVFAYIAPSIVARVTCTSLAILILLLVTGSQLRNVTIPKLEVTSRWAGYIFFIAALGPCIWALLSILRSGPIEFFSKSLSSWHAAFLSVFTVTWTFFFFFLNSSRLEMDLESARFELELISRTDPLTNLYNRRYFDEQAEHEFQRAKRSGSSNALLLLDVDEFKSINDLHGHDVGDAVLITLATVLRSELRSFDLIARYGGDEFIIMLTDTQKEEAYSIAERIRRRIFLTPFAVRTRIFNVTLSAGIASLEPTDTHLRTFLKRGDDALYRAKEQGRNCVVVA